MGLFEFLGGKWRKPKNTTVFPTGISYDSEELRRLIVQWTENESWTPKTFLEILEEIGVKAPVRLSNLDKEKNSFTCLSADGTTVGLELFFGDMFDFNSEVRITRGEETLCYYVWSSSDTPDVVTIKKQIRILKRGNKKLESYYCEYFCHRTLYFGDTHILRVDVDEPAGSKDKNKTQKNAEFIEEYLMDLSEPVSAQEIYKKVIQLLDFSKEDVQNSEKIMIAYCTVETDEEGNKSKEEGRSIVYQRKGEMVDYGVLENGETFLVCRNGDWKYISDSVKIHFTADSGKCSVKMQNATIDQMKQLQTAQLIEQVRARISQLRNHVE